MSDCSHMFTHVIKCSDVSTPTGTCWHSKVWSATAQYWTEISTLHGPGREGTVRTWRSKSAESEMWSEVVCHRGMMVCINTPVKWDMFPTSAICSLFIRRGPQDITVPCPGMQRTKFPVTNRNTCMQKHENLLNDEKVHEDSNKSACKWHINLI